MAAGARKRPVPRLQLPRRDRRRRPSARFSEVSGLTADGDAGRLPRGHRRDQQRAQADRPAQVRHIVLKRGYTQNDELWNWYQRIRNGAPDRRNGSDRPAETRPRTPCCAGTSRPLDQQDRGSDAEGDRQRCRHRERSRSASSGLRLNRLLKDAEYLTPGVYYEPTDATRAGSVPFAPTSPPSWGWRERGPLHTAWPVESWRQFQAVFGGFSGALTWRTACGFFENGGRRC